MRLYRVCRYRLPKQQKDGAISKNDGNSALRLSGETHVYIRRYRGKGRRSIRLIWGGQAIRGGWCLRRVGGWIRCGGRWCNGIAIGGRPEHSVDSNRFESTGACPCWLTVQARQIPVLRESMVGSVAVDARCSRVATGAVTSCVIAAIRIATNRRRIRMESSFWIETIAAIEVVVEMVQSCGPFRRVA